MCIWKALPHSLRMHSVTVSRCCSQGPVNLCTPNPVLAYTLCSALTLSPGCHQHPVGMSGIQPRSYQISAAGNDTPAMRLWAQPQTWVATLLLGSCTPEDLRLSHARHVPPPCCCCCCCQQLCQAVRGLNSLPAPLPSSCALRAFMFMPSLCSSAHLNTLPLYVSSKVGALGPVIAHIPKPKAVTIAGGDASHKLAASVSHTLQCSVCGSGSGHGNSADEESNNKAMCAGFYTVLRHDLACCVPCVLLLLPALLT